MDRKKKRDREAIGRKAMTSKAEKPSESQTDW